MPPADPDFERNVFINCPFDRDYAALLRPLVFTVACAGLRARIASERFDSGEGRFDKICELIEISRYSIHDLSRIQAAQAHEYYRMNMPFELGVDIGCRRFKGNEAATKRCLILEKERFRYQRALSDLSGSDIKSHDDEPEKLVRQVRNWLVELGVPGIPSASRLWEDFNEFMAAFYLARQQEGYRAQDLEEMPLPEYIGFIDDWLGARRAPRPD
jgi:hypothetical protein